MSQATPGRYYRITRYTRNNPERRTTPLSQNPKHVEHTQQFVAARNREIPGTVVSCGLDQPGLKPGVDKKFTKHGEKRLR